jgi:hypothetical protein
MLPMDYIYHLILTWSTCSIIYLSQKKAATFPHLTRENYASNSTSKGSHSFETAHALSYPVYAQSSSYLHPAHPYTHSYSPTCLDSLTTYQPSQNRPPPPFVPHSAIFPCKLILPKDQHMGFHHQLFSGPSLHDPFQSPPNFIPSRCPHSVRDFPELHQGR